MNEYIQNILNSLGGGQGSNPQQLGLNFGDVNLNKGFAKVKTSSPFAAEVMKPPSTLNRALGKFAMGDKFIKNPYMQNLGKVGGRALPLFVAIDAATELADQSDPFQKNLAEGIGKAGGTIGGAYGGAAIGGALGGGVLSPITAPIGAILGAILMSDAGKQLAGGAYRAVNPRGELEYAKKQIQKQAEIQRELNQANRAIALERARDDQRLAIESALINAAINR